ncbi:MAG: hypothetical protein LUH10_00165 [Tannerellaceae bacterium]|nr:hypothetical protein [Tannerellaceae bacterium]
MTKSELKKLSNDTFFDNSKGGITPEAHREFNNSLIDSTATAEQGAKADTAIQGATFGGEAVKNTGGILEFPAIETPILGVVLACRIMSEGRFIYKYDPTRILSTITRESTGLYRIIHNIGNPYFMVSATGMGTVCSVSARGSNFLTISNMRYATAELIDGDFDVIIVKA